MKTLKSKFSKLVIVIIWLSSIPITLSFLKKERFENRNNGLSSGGEEIIKFLKRDIEKQTTKINQPRVPLISINDSIDAAIDQLDISPINKLIQSAFNRDSLLDIVHYANANCSFSNFSIQLLSTNTSNNIKILIDDPINLGLYLRSPKVASDLPPILVCDFVIVASAFGPTRNYNLLLEWREKYFREHPRACQLRINNNLAPQLRRVYNGGLAYKLLHHLFLIKAISDGRIITSSKYNEILNSGFLISDHSSNRPMLKNSADENSVKEFIRLLTPHMYSGIGIPSSDLNMSSYPIIFFLDMDTLITNKNMNILSFLERIDRGLKLRPIMEIPVPKNNKNKLRNKNKNKNNLIDKNEISSFDNSSDFDFIIGTDLGRSNETTLNSGAHLSRPTSSLASLLWMAIQSFSLDPRHKKDQRSIIIQLERMANFSSSDVLSEFKSGHPRWARPEFEDRIIFKSFLNSFSKNSEDRNLSSVISQMEQTRKKQIELIWGPSDNSVEDKNSLRKSLAIVVDGRWFNSLYTGRDSERVELQWHPGDWIVHFVRFFDDVHNHRTVREWICNNLEFVSPPDGWPSSENDCPNLIENGFLFQANNKKKKI